MPDKEKTVTLVNPQLDVETLNAVKFICSKTGNVVPFVTADQVYSVEQILNH